MASSDELDSLLKRIASCLHIYEYNKFHGLVFGKDVAGATAHLQSVNTDNKNFGSEMYLEIKRKCGEADYLAAASEGIDRAPELQAVLDCWVAFDIEELQAAVNEFADETYKQLGGLETG